MGKTFDEWFRENDVQLEDLVYDSGSYGDGYFSYSQFELALKAAWEASRNNMTYKDI